MVGGPVCLSVNSPISIENASAFCNSDCKCCAIMKSEVQALDKEVKSLAEIINTLSEELKVDCANKEASKSTFAHVGKCKTSSTQCSKCVQLESQLQVATNEISSLKLITDLLSAECKSLKKSTQVDTNAVNLWSKVKPNIVRGPNTTSQPNLVHSFHGASNFDQYAIPISNCYAVVSNNFDLQQLNDSTFSPDVDQPMR